jgi:signal peptidase
LKAALAVRSLKESVRSLILIGAMLGSALAAYSILVLASGVGQPMLLVPSRSMEPTIDAGDVIAIRAISPLQIRLGDVVIYQQAYSQVLLIHRVVCIVTSTSSECTGSLYVYMKCRIAPCYYTKGDNEPGPDPWVVSAGQIVGVWTGFRIPYFAMAFICLKQDAQCPSPWRPLSLIALGSAVAGDLVFEYWISKRTWKSKAAKQIISRKEDPRVDPV